MSRRRSMTLAEAWTPPSALADEGQGRDCRSAVLPTEPRASEVGGQALDLPISKADRLEAFSSTGLLWRSRHRLGRCPTLLSLGESPSGGAARLAYRGYVEARQGIGIRTYHGSTTFAGHHWSNAGRRYQVLIRRRLDGQVGSAFRSRNRVKRNVPRDRCRAGGIAIIDSARAKRGDLRSATVRSGLA